VRALTTSNRPAAPEQRHQRHRPPHATAAQLFLLVLIFPTIPQSPATTVPVTAQMADFDGSAVDLIATFHGHLIARIVRLIATKGQNRFC
jgi:hypothetical protein